LTDSLAKIQIEIRHIENVDYLKQFESPAGISIEGICKANGKIRNGDDPFSEILTTVVEGELVNLIGYKQGYWSVNKDEYYGYISDLYIKSTKKVERFKEELIRTNQKNKLKSTTKLNSGTTSNKTQISPDKSKSNFSNTSNSTYRKSYSSKSYKSTKRSSTQCYGKTKKGKRCKNRTTSVSGRCHLH